jgi:hypothetical protein
MFKIIQQRLVEQIKEGALLKEKLQQSIKKLKLKLKELTRELKSYLKHFFKANLGYKSYINKLKNLLNFYKKDLKRSRAEYHMRFAKKEKFQKKKKLKTSKSYLKNFKRNFVICCKNIENIFLFYIKKLLLLGNFIRKIFIKKNFILNILKRVVFLQKKASFIENGTLITFLISKKNVRWLFFRHLDN